MNEDRIYIDHSVTFDTNEYRHEVYRECLRAAGANRFSLRRIPWRNQPQHLGFTGLTIKQATAALGGLPEFRHGVLFRFGDGTPAVDF